MSLATLIGDIRSCRACSDELPHPPRPVIRVGERTRLLICGQAPGRRADASGLPFDDPSGDRLRDWMGVDYQTFYDHPAIGVAAMAFCFPGTSPKGGDYPPPPRCAALWRRPLLAALPQVELTLLVGSYAQTWALGPAKARSLSDTVEAWRSFPPGLLPLPHPSWRNTAWIKRRPWFEAELVPHLRQQVSALLNSGR